MTHYVRKIPAEGMKYGNLTLTGNYAISKSRETIVELVCECGKLFRTRWGNIKIGKTKSCGCRTTELKVKAMTTHGLSNRNKIHPVYTTWYGIKSRCYNEKCIEYKNYGGRGIALCDEWLNDVVCFYNWAINNGWEKGLTIDRKEVNGNYSPGNCRWISNIEQQKNKRGTIWISMFGETKIQADWCRDFRAKVSERTFSERIKKGWKPEEALTVVLRA